MDRYAQFGADLRNAGLQFAITLLEGQREEEEACGDVAEVGSLAYFLPVLEETSREWRRHEKARRRAKEPGPSNDSTRAIPTPKEG